MVKTYKSKALAAAHENVSDLFRLGLVDRKTMRKFDAACLTPVPKQAQAAIRSVRRKGDVSQAVLAAHQKRKKGTT
jgi:putative transcriptional regulator